jgi:exosome complex component CSL4
MDSHSSGRKNSQFVVPGERLGVIEEFTASSGTYVQDGVIYSQVTGRALLDLLNKRVSVRPVTRKVRVPSVGSIVLGQVSSVEGQNAFVRVLKIEGKRLSGFFTGVLHISDVQLRYVDSMFAVCKPGDILRAKVISEKNGRYHLSTVDKNLGVVYAFCSRCGYALESRRGYMSCPRCGKVEKRKEASDYGIGVI